MPFKLKTWESFTPPFDNDVYFDTRQVSVSYIICHKAQGLLNHSNGQIFSLLNTVIKD